jgi:hypothetical protein
LNEKIDRDTISVFSHSTSTSQVPIEKMKTQKAKNKVFTDAGQLSIRKKRKEKEGWGGKRPNPYAH